MTPKNPETIKNSLFKYKSIYCLVVMFYCGTAFAQVNPEEKKPASTPPASGILQPDAMMDVRERLVQLALQNPTYEVADRKVSIAGFQVKKAKTSWLAAIVVQGNYNEFTINNTKISTGNGTTTSLATLYPKYNIGATIPFDLFSIKRNDIKIAKQNLSIAQAEKNQRFREIKAQVLTKYEDYLLLQDRLDFQSQLTQDARTAYLAAEKDFQEGAIKQEEYNRSYRGWLDEKIKQKEYQRNYNVIKLELEAMIGVSIDDVIKK